MNFIGDYFAIGLVIVLSMFFFDGKHSLNKTSKYFVACLFFTAATAVTNIMSGQLMAKGDASLFLNMAVNTLYFIANLLTTSSIAMYLFTKILEHNHDKHCMKNAVIGLAACLSVYVVMLALNLKTGWLFYFNEQNEYCRGPLNSIGYFITVVQMILVLICYSRNRKNASATMRRVLIQTFPVVVMCIIIQRMYPEIMLNSFIMTMVATVLFLTFKGHRHGVHALTRLNDRHRFFEDLETRMKSANPYQVFMIHIKNFGVINQKHGHMFGDELLYQFAFALEKLIALSEAYHMNGTVFALVLPVLNQSTAEKHRSMILNFLESGISCVNDHITLDYVAVEYIIENESCNAAELYEMLEYAAAKAYRNGHRYTKYTPDIGNEMLRRRYLIERMQHIDHEHGFRTWFQPIRCMKSGKFCSMEALVRLIEPDGTVISPAEFIPVAEQTGMITSITWFVIEDVCRILRDNPELANTSVGINLPMAQLLDRGFMVRVNSIVDSYGIAHDRIGLEFTERAIPENFEQMQHVMEQCAQDGYRFYLDDFGAGSSNFNCMLQLPFHNIKLDTNLIRMDINNNGKQTLGLVRTLTQFLHDIDMVVVAEGVESGDVAAVLGEIGIDRIQGYIYAKPMDEKALIDFYKNI